MCAACGPQIGAASVTSRDTHERTNARRHTPLGSTRMLPRKCVSTNLSLPSSPRFCDLDARYNCGLSSPFHVTYTASHCLTITQISANSGCRLSKNADDRFRVSDQESRNIFFHLMRYLTSISGLRAWLDFLSEYFQFLGALRKEIPIGPACNQRSRDPGGYTFLRPLSPRREMHRIRSRTTSRDHAEQKYCVRS